MLDEPIIRSEIPTMDLMDAGDHLILKVEVPGVNPEDLDISIKDNMLTITGERREEKHSGEGDTRQERTYSSFSRAIQLPCKIEMKGVKANYQNGTLTIQMPKCEQQSGRTIKINVK
jgi:HSP20 family protein